MICFFLSGTVPMELCNVGSLTNLKFAENAGITCYAGCLDNVCPPLLPPAAIHVLMCHPVNLLNTLL